MTSTFGVWRSTRGYWRVKIAYVGILGHLTRDIFRAVFTRKRALNPY